MRRGCSHSTAGSSSPVESGPSARSSSGYRSCETGANVTVDAMMKLDRRDTLFRSRVAPSPGTEVTGSNRSLLRGFGPESRSDARIEPGISIPGPLAVAEVIKSY